MNEEVDPLLTIERLKKEIERLKAELVLVGGGMSEDALPEYELVKVRGLVDLFLKGEGELVFGDIRKINHAFQVLKVIVFLKRLF